MNFKSIQSRIELLLLGSAGMYKDNQLWAVVLRKVETKRLGFFRTLLICLLVLEKASP